MSMFHKIDYNKAYSIGRKLHNSREATFMRKRWNDKKMYKHLGNQISDKTMYSNIGRALQKPSTYRTISKKLGEVRKLNSTVSKNVSGISPEIGLMYPSGEIDYGLGMAQRTSNRVGRGLSKVKKSKSPLEKGVNIAQTTSSIGRDFI